MMWRDRTQDRENRQRPSLLQERSIFEGQKDRRFEESRRSSYSRKVALADNEQRAEVKKAEAAKWAGLLASFTQKINLPSGQLLSSSTDTRGWLCPWSEQGGRAHHETRGRHGAASEDGSRPLQGGGIHPTLVDFGDYIHLLADLECGKSVPGASWQPCPSSRMSEESSPTNARALSRFSSRRRRAHRWRGAKAQRRPRRPSHTLWLR